MDLLRQRRKELGLTQAALARRAGDIDPRTISRTEQGRTRLSSERAKSLGAALKEDPTRLMELSGYPGRINRIMSVLNNGDEPMRRLYGAMPRRIRDVFTSFVDARRAEQQARTHHDNAVHDGDLRLQRSTLKEWHAAFDALAERSQAVTAIAHRCSAGMHGAPELQIHQLRMSRGWTQHDLAEFAKLPLPTVKRADRGRKFSKKTAASLARVFDVPEEKLLSQVNVFHQFRAATRKLLRGEAVPSSMLTALPPDLADIVRQCSVSGTRYREALALQSRAERAGGARERAALEALSAAGLAFTQATLSLSQRWFRFL